MSLADHLNRPAVKPHHLTQVNLQTTPLEHVYTLLRLSEEDEPQATLIGLTGSLSRAIVPEERTYFIPEEIHELLSCKAFDYYSITAGGLAEHRLIVPNEAMLLREDLTPAAGALNLVATAIWKAAFVGTKEKDIRGLLLSEFVIAGPVLVMLDNEIPY